MEPSHRSSGPQVKVVELGWKSTLHDAVQLSLNEPVAQVDEVLVAPMVEGQVTEAQKINTQARQRSSTTNEVPGVVHARPLVVQC